MDNSLDNCQKTISFLSIVNSALGSVNVNFDAETQAQRLRSEDYQKIYDFGLSWSETFQAGSTNGETASDRAERIRGLLERYNGRLSANLVIGNAAYGIRSNFASLQEMTMKLSNTECGELKLGAEGRINGRKAIDLASKTGSIAYVLHTSFLNDLLGYANERKVASMVYSLCRLSEFDGNSAKQEAVRIKGTGYFERRGVACDEVLSRAGEFGIFGKSEDVVREIRSLIDSGVSKVVLYPIFCSADDLARQLALLSNWMCD